MGKVDIHNHLGRSLDGGCGTIDEILTVMDRCDIEKSVIFATDEEDMGETYEKPNERMLNFQKQYPDRLIAFVRVIPTVGQKAKDEIKKALDRGVKGLKLKCIDGYTPQDCIEIIEMIKDIKNFPVLMHTENGRNSKPDDWDPIIAAYPQINFILAHGGKADYRNCAKVANRYINAYIDTSTLSFHRTRTIYSLVGADKLLFASDYPYSHPEIELKKYELILQNEAEKKKVYEINARKVLGL